MKSLSSALKAHIEGEVTTLATCWKITRTDGTVLGFTNHDEDIIVSAVTYEAATGFSPTAIQSNETLSVDNMEAEGLIDSSTITEGDLIAGLYDYAAVEMFMVNYASVGMGLLKLKKGTFGEVTVKRDQFTAEVRSLSQNLQQNIGEVYSPECRATFGDTRCGITIQPAYWEPLTAYATGTEVLPITHNGRRYVCTTSGTSQQATFSSSLSINVSLTNSSTTVTQSSGINAGAVINQDITGGKFYWEFNASTLASTTASAVAFGVTLKTSDVGYSSVIPGSYAFLSEFTSAPIAGDQFQCAFNGNSRKLWVGKNGSWLSGDPTTGANAYAQFPNVYNKLKKTRLFNATAYWSTASGITIYASAITAPDGTNTAQNVGAPTGNYKWVGQDMAVSYTSGDVINSSIYVRRNNNNRVAIRHENPDTGNASYVVWTLSTSGPPTYYSQGGTLASVISHSVSAAVINWEELKYKARLKEAVTTLDFRFYTTWDQAGYYFQYIWGALHYVGTVDLGYTEVNTTYTSTAVYPWVGMKSNADSGPNVIDGVFTSANFAASAPADYLELGEPSWNTTVGGSTTDGTAVWTTYNAYLRFGTVTSKTDNSNFTDSALVETSSLFAGGKLIWITGLNAGRSMEVKKSTAAGAITLFQKMAYDVAVGDEYKIILGCVKTTAACNNFAPENGSHGNIYNFRGEPTVPSVDDVTKFGGQ